MPFPLEIREDLWAIESEFRLLYRRWNAASILQELSTVTLYHAYPRAHILDEGGLPATGVAASGSRVLTPDFILDVSDERLARVLEVGGLDTKDPLQTRVPPADRLDEALRMAEDVANPERVVADLERALWKLELIFSAPFGLTEDEVRESIESFKRTIPFTKRGTNLRFRCT